MYLLSYNYLISDPVNFQGILSSVLLCGIFPRPRYNGEPRSYARIGRMARTNKRSFRFIPERSREYGERAGIRAWRAQFGYYLESEFEASPELSAPRATRSICAVTREEGACEALRKARRAEWDTIPRDGGSSGELRARRGS